MYANISTRNDKNPGFDVEWEEFAGDIKVSVHTNSHFYFSMLPEEAQTLYDKLGQCLLDLSFAKEVPK